MRRRRGVNTWHLPFGRRGHDASQQQGSRGATAVSINIRLSHLPSRHLTRRPVFSASTLGVRAHLQRGDAAAGSGSGGICAGCRVRCGVDQCEARRYVRRNESSVEHTQRVPQLV